MVFKPGHKSLGGRKKGVPNKNKQELLERVKEKYPGYCPIEAMCEIALNNGNDVSIRLQASKEVASYIYPKLKSIEHTGDADNPINHSVTVEIIGSKNTDT